MTTPLAVQTPDASSRPVGTSADAQELIKHFSEVTDALLGLIDVETKLVRAGRLREAASLEQQKAGLARLYIKDAMCLRISTPYLSKAMPEVVQILRQRHDNFRALLQINLTVLATAHAVSEGIMRGVSDEIVRKSMPQTYGASGRHNVANPRIASRPLTMSRTL